MDQHLENWETFLDSENYSFGENSFRAKFRNSLILYHKILILLHFIYKFGENKILWTKKTDFVELLSPCLA